MELKWTMLTFAALFACIAIIASTESYNSTQCKIAYAKSDKTPEEISKLCK